MRNMKQQVGSTPWHPGLITLSLRDRLDRCAAKVAAKKRWDLLTVLIAGALGLVMARPDLTQVTWSPQWTYIVQHSSGDLFPADIDPAGREANLTFRVVPRLLGNLLGFTDPWHFVALQVVFGALLIYTVARLFDQALQDRSLAIVATVGTTGLWAIATSWADFRGNFDGMALTLLLLAMYARLPIAVLLTAIAATFTDERAIFVIPIVALWHIQRGSDDDANPSRLPLSRERWCALMAIGAVAIHLVVRMWMKQRYGLTEGTNRSPGNPWAQLNNYPSGVWGALEGFWLVVLAGLATMVHVGRRWQAAAATASVTGTLLVGMSVFDISRSVAFVFPVVPLALLALRPIDRAWVRGAVWIAVAISLLWPLLYAADDRTVTWILPVPLQLLHSLLPE